MFFYSSPAAVLGQSGHGCHSCLFRQGLDCIQPSIVCCNAQKGLLQVFHFVCNNPLFNGFCLTQSYYVKDKRLVSLSHKTRDVQPAVVHMQFKI